MIKKITVAIPQMILILIGIPFYLFDLMHKNYFCEKVINQINIWVFKLDEWSDK